MQCVTDLLQSTEYRSELLALRSNPVKYIAEKNCSEENLVQCLCKILNSEHCDENLNFNVLLVIQECASVVITTQESFLEAITTLNNLFRLTKSPTQNFLRAQTLMAITTTLFTCEELINKELYASWFIMHYHQLWKLIQNINNNDDFVLREAACDCLIDIENTYPCLLLHKSKDLVSLSFEEDFYPFQNYANLTSAILRNAVKFDPTMAFRTNEILRTMNQALLTKDHVTSTVSSLNMSQILVQLIDLTPLLSTSSNHYLVSNVQEIVKELKMSPSIFKSFFQRNLLTYDLVMIHLNLTLKIFQNNFHDSLFTKAKDDPVVEQIISVSNEPHYSCSQRCLLLEWIMLHLRKTDLTCDVETFIPLPWDSLEVEERKLQILALMFSRDMPEKQAIIMRYFEGFVPSLAYDLDGQQITTLCRLLFLCNSKHGYGDSDDELLKILLKILSNYPQFTGHILELVSKIKKLKPHSALPNSVISSAVKHVMDLPVEIANKNIIDHLLLLEKAAEENENLVRPHEILNFISQSLNHLLLEEDESKSTVLGCLGLDVCRQLLCHHNTDANSAALGKVLSRIFSEHGDPDIRDRAQFYYVLLTTLSPGKVTDMLNFKPQNETGSANVKQFVSSHTDDAFKINPVKIDPLAQDSCCFERIYEKFAVYLFGLVQPKNSSFRLTLTCGGAYSNPPTVDVLSEHTLKLTRISVQLIDSIDEEMNSDITGDLTSYFEFLEAEEIYWNTTFEYELSILPDVDPKYEKLYAIVLSFHGTNSSSEAQDVEILHLAKNGESARVCMNIAPASTVPSTISVSALFSVQDGSTCCSQLDPIYIAFQDLLHPLPVPSKYCRCPTVWRQALSKELWKLFTSNSVKSSCHSVVTVTMSREQYAMALCTVLRPYVTLDFFPDDVELKCTLGMFLPQRCHLILKMKYVEEEEGVVVCMAADNQDALALMNIFLRNMEE